MPIVGARSNDPVLMSMAVPTALAQFVFVAMAFAALAACYVTSDFSVLNVYENSNSAMPFIYRLTSVWGNHEGSMMLWVLILALFGALVAAFGNNLPAKLKANALAVQAWIAAAFHLFILTTSNPFLRIADAPFEGRDLNPVLQDPGLAFHPPLLYLGYVGFSIAFSFAIAALLEGRIDAAWARWVRPWVLGAWMCLTLGIAGGSYWAYYELGWGGFWFWDPVENASLMPWLAGTALLHSAVVMEKRGALKVWTILLAILAFSLSLIGTFLVRSGVLTSVHAFAIDPRRGIFILAILVVFIGGALLLYAVSRAAAQTGRLVCADLARRRARLQQSVSDVGLRDGVRRHALSAGARSVDRREDFRRSAVLQCDVRPAIRPAVADHAVRTAAWMEARRPARRRATSVRGGDARCRRDGGGIRAPTWRRPGAGAVRRRARGLRHGRRADRYCRAHHVLARSVRRRAAARGRIAAFGVGHGFCAFRDRRHACSASSP